MIRVAHSPDSDDRVMFWAIERELVDLEGLSFSLESADTETLNRGDSTWDVWAISAAAYPWHRAAAMILPHGASVGRGFGPVLVCRPGNEAEPLASRRIAIPGARTTAAAVLRRVCPEAETVEIPITPFERVFAALETGEVDAAVLIHEGQLAYRERGLVKLLDMGSWWMERFGLPLPLGVNVIRRSLGPERIAAVSRVLARALDWSLANRGAILESLGGDAQHALSPAMLDEYLDRYVNEDTRRVDADCRRSLALLIDIEQGALAADFAP